MNRVCTLAWAAAAVATAAALALSSGVAAAARAKHSGPATAPSAASMAASGAADAASAPVSEMLSPQAYRDASSKRLGVCKSVAAVYYLSVKQYPEYLQAMKTLGSTEVDAPPSKDLFVTCVGNMKDWARVAGPGVVNATKKPVARDALKAYQIALITAVNGIEAQDDETRGGYARRQSDLQSKLDEAWSRYEVEE